MLLKSSNSVFDNSGKVMTVKGPLDPEELGMTLMHEHLFFESIMTTTRAPDINTPMMETKVWDDPLSVENLALIGVLANGNRYGTYRNKDNSILADLDLAVEEISEFRNQGGASIVDVTNIGIRRDPISLMKVSMRTGLNIIAGSSWYVKASHQSDMDFLTVEQLTDAIVQDITVGIGDTGIRAGVIGEVGINGEPLTDNEIKIIKASARASRRTGAPISFHWGGTGLEKMEVASLVSESGGEMCRTIFGHSDVSAGDVDLLLSLLEKGVYIQFDLLGRVGVPLSWDVLNTTSPWPEYLSFSGAAIVADTISKLFSAGYGDRILISHDVCTKVQLKKFGGTGYSFIPEVFLPYLRRIGFTEEQLHLIMVENPKRILTFVTPE